MIFSTTVLPRHMLSVALVVMGSRVTPTHAFVWSSVWMTRSSRGRPFSAVPPSARRPSSHIVAGRMRSALLGALPVTASLTAGMQLRAGSTAITDSPDETWEVVRTPGDGSCLFHAVQVTAQMDAKELRKVAADSVDANVDVEFNGASLRQWIDWETDMTPDEYAKRLRVGNWGGQIELCLLARGLDTRWVEVVRHFRTASDFVCAGVPSSTCESCINFFYLPSLGSRSTTSRQRARLSYNMYFRQRQRGASLLSPSACCTMARIMTRSCVRAVALLHQQQ
jgi:hypothetical protein